MKDIRSDDSRPKVALAMGFFDSVHKGHRAIIKHVVECAQYRGIKSAIMTFIDNPKLSKYMYSYSQRLRLYESQGLDYCMPLSLSHREMSAEDFLLYCVDKFDLQCVVCGVDFVYGNGAVGNVESLSQFCKDYNIDCKIISPVECSGYRVSSTVIGRLLNSGNLELANNMLQDNYHIVDTVVHGFGRGKQLLPTANFAIDKDRYLPCDGVYGTHVLLNTTWYKSITNIGRQPTFDSCSRAIETHIIGFDGNLYGQDITIRFDKLLRDIVRFDSIDSLRLQLYKDMLWS